ncbi:MAG: hypothetical protein P8J37_07420 [Fuerstiella sp.]|nr:hypothetical protein [Fuerstiella sp.]
MPRFLLCVFTGLLFLTQCSVPLPAQEKQGETSEVAVEKADGEAKPEYVRIRRNDRRLAAALETSVILFGNSKRYPKTTVELIGAIHLGESQYYDKLNSMFSKYDVLLYEAVMPKEAVRRGFRPGVGGGRRSLTDEDQWTEAKIGLQAISVLQLGAKDALGLEFQLAGVDYTSGNFVHADMTQEEFEASMANRGESFSQMLAREMGKAALQQQQVNPFAQSLDLALSLLASDRKYRVRRIAAVELTKANDDDAFAGSDGTSTIITERNTKALEVLNAQLKKGRKRIGVFYGAGHFPDMEKRVLDEFGYERISEEWVTAWELRAPIEK